MSWLNFATIGLLLVVLSNQRKQRKQNERTHMKLSELKANLDEATKQIRKGTDEVVLKIKALEDAINTADPEVPQEVQDALAELKTASQGLDDTVPDAAEIPAEGGEQA